MHRQYPPPYQERAITGQSDYRYDVFISCSRNDEAWMVNTLLPRLEAAGLRVRIDFRDFAPGKSSFTNHEVQANIGGRSPGN